MNKVTYLRAALFLPLVTALLAWLLTWGGYDHPLLSLALALLAMGAVPWLLTLLMLLVLSYRAPLRAFEQWWWRAPFLMALSCGVMALVIMIFNGLSDGWKPELVTSFFSLWLVTGIYSLVIGYGYVLVAATLHGLLRKSGLAQR